MRVIPVIDLKAGKAVHAVAGDRDHYRPLRTRLHEGSDPLDLALAFRDVLGLSELYVADLDAIAGSEPQVWLFHALGELGFALWIDAGVRDGSELPPLLSSGVQTVIAGLETLGGPAALAEIVAEIGPQRLVFSLDLRAGRALIAPGADWVSDDPRRLAEAALGLGVRRLLLLDLARVGTSRGPGTEELLADLVDAHQRAEISVGGGISGPDDLLRLARAGASAVLVGSALHDARIRPADLQTYRK
jgi:phosphoribosylformimino-5-aminoimidazole carboxamide ribotide isomerase